MGKITQQILNGKVLLSDGAWGTELQKKGLTFGECPELWNISNRKNVFDIAKSYIDSGSDIIETNSFGGNRFRLEHFGLESQLNELNRTAAEISREAAGNEKLVLGSIGPSGKMLMMGNISEAELYDGFASQAEALEQGGVDAFLVETFSAIDEAECAIKAIKDNSSLEIICTFTFEKTLDGSYKTMMGTSIPDMVNATLAAGADIIGTNCGNGIERMVEIILEMKMISSNIPLIVHSNAGLPLIKNGEIYYQETPEIMAAFIPQLIANGAKIIGGCCGTTPAHIKIFREALDKIQ
jgi:Methionine synthase I (cobalamin-dependent), methyltransferase domain